MEVRNSAAESQTSDQSQPIQEIDGGSNLVGGPPDAVGASGGGGGLEAELGNGDAGADMVKKKRGRPPRAQAKSPPVKMIKEEDEDVCFICFDGGSLVLCDRRGCPKAYHPACVKRDDAFFQSTAKWNCGWHICSVCQKAAHHMCYTCTYSLCKVCIKKADYFRVRGDKGFCNVCMKTIMLIEDDGPEKDEKAKVDFDDKTSWEYLFKVYWVYLKGKLSLTVDELKQAKSPSKVVTTTTTTTTMTLVTPSTFVENGVNDLNLEASESKRRKTDEKTIIPPKETVTTKKAVINGSSRVVACKDWATKELLDFVSHMKNGDTSVLSQFDVQELMLEYIKRNNLRDPRKKSQIICDSRLKILFGKPRVGHFEMLKLLEFHFFIKEDTPKNTINGLSKQVDPDWNIENIVTMGKDKKRKNHKKIEERAPQNNLDEFAAINVHNMNLIYLRRKLMENLIEDSEECKNKVVGSIVRIRISGSDQKHDMYRLVQVVGTNKADKPYKVGAKSADFVLEVLNLDKKENVSIDTISNQDLSEDECRRLRQSIRCGLVKRFTVGEIQDKAVSLQSARLNDLMEAERLRLNNLRDRASEKGHKKSLREYVEKLQLLKTPEERERRLREIPEVHSDPKMNPDYETDDTEEYFNKEHEEKTKPKYSGISRKNTITPKKRADLSIKVSSRSWKNEENSTKAIRKINIKKDPHGSSSLTLARPDYNGSTVTNRNHNTASETSTPSYSMKNSPIMSESETEKVWHYRDPSGKIQGPFCMIQLQKWSTTGYFPNDMRIWTNREDESLLLNDVLKDQLNSKNVTEKAGINEKLSDTHGPTGLTVQIGKSNIPELASPTPVETISNVKNVSSAFSIGNADFEDLPSPTPKNTIHEDEKVKNDLEIVVPEIKDVGVSETGNEWSGYSPTHAVSVTATAAIEPPVSQAEFSIVAPWEVDSEESVSDLLAEVDAMESQNGFASPTSTRNSFVEDLFNGSFEDFSPTPFMQGVRSNPFSQSFQPPTTTAATSTTTVDVKVEADVAEGVQIEEKPVQIHPDYNDREGESGQPATTKPKDPSPELALEIKTEKMETDGGTVQSGKAVEPPSQPPPQPLPPPPVSLAIGVDAVYPRQGSVNNFGRAGQEMMSRVNPHSNMGRPVNVGWEPPQLYGGGERFNNSNSRSFKIEDSGYGRNGASWGRQPPFGGYMRPLPPNGKRVCKFYESGRCKKGASCNYWHP